MDENPEIVDIEQSGLKNRARFRQSKVEVEENLPEKTKQKAKSPQINQENTRCKLSTNKEIALSIGIIAMFFLSYLKSLEGCPHRPIRVTICLNWLKQNGPFLAIFGVMSALFNSVFLLLIFYRIINKLWIIAAIISLAIAYNYQDGFGFDDHGFFNRAILIFSIVVILALFFSVKIIVHICRKGKSHILAVCSCFTFAIVLLYITRISSSCNNWSKGLKGRQLLDLPGECKVQVPNYCELTIRDGWFDINSLTKECHKYKMKVERSWLRGKLKDNPNIKKIGYPRIEFHPNEYRADEDKFKEYVIDRIIDMDDPNIPQSVKDNIEFTIDMTDSEAHIVNIDLKRNNCCLRYTF